MSQVRRASVALAFGLARGRRTSSGPCRFPDGEEPLPRGHAVPTQLKTKTYRVSESTAKAIARLARATGLNFDSLLSLAARTLESDTAIQALIDARAALDLDAERLDENAN